MRWIEWILFRTGRPEDISPVQFEIFRYVDKEFVIFRILYYKITPKRFGTFAITKQVCQNFLDYLSYIIDTERDIMTEYPDIPQSEIAGFSSTELRDTEYVMYRDGLAFLENLSKMEPEGRLIWNPHNGCRTE